MRERTRLTSKGQIVLPKELRERLNWRPGLRLSVREEGGGVILEPLADDVESLIDSLHGCMIGDDPVGELEREHREEVQRERRRRDGGGRSDRR